MQSQKKVKIQEYPANQQQYVEIIPQKLKEYLDSEPQLDENGVWDVQSECSEQKKKNRLTDLYGFVDEYLDQSLRKKFKNIEFKYVRLWEIKNNGQVYTGLSFAPTDETWGQIELSFKKGRDNQLIPSHLSTYIFEDDNIDLIQFVTKIHEEMTEKGEKNTVLPEDKLAEFTSHIPNIVKLPNVKNIQILEKNNHIWAIKFSAELVGFRLTFKRKQYKWQIEFKLGQGVPQQLLPSINEKNYINLFNALNICCQKK